MKNLERRIQRLEERLLPAPETEFSRLLRLRMDKGGGAWPNSTAKLRRLPLR